ncbi:uncharacterized protein [Dysidea avara]|uniref:uncharacterized protein isoform X2 n=1 Tax=Dysidea avara TaxID=196820 RepID=UPI00332C0562
MSIEEAFAYYSPFATTKLIMELPDQDQNHSDQEDEVRTLFVSGLPMDVRPREIYLLFRTYSGYTGSSLKLMAKHGKIPQPVAFVSFQTRLQALKAKNDLQGVRFDPESNITLRLEFAHANSRTSPRYINGVPMGTTLTPNRNTYVIGNPYSTQAHLSPDPWSAQQTSMQLAYGNARNHMMTSHGHMMTSHGHMMGQTTPSPMSAVQVMNDGDHMSTTAYMIPQPQFYIAGDEMAHYMNEAVPQQINVTAPDDLSTGSLGDISPSDLVGSQPCSTLFVANLEPHHTENDIGHLFEKYDGFGKAKQYTKGGPPVCFVEFKDVESATTAMNDMQGHVMDSSKRGSGIRIEYAKQKMGAPSRSTCISSGPPQVVSYLNGSAFLPGDASCMPVNGFVDSNGDSSPTAMNGHISDNNSLEI